MVTKNETNPIVENFACTQYAERWYCEFRAAM